LWVFFSTHCALGHTYAQTFLAGELRVNITKHELVPKHIVLSEEDKRTLLKRYHLQVGKVSQPC
jgi:hypothetical protein